MNLYIITVSAQIGFAWEWWMVSMGGAYWGTYDAGVLNIKKNVSLNLSWAFEVLKQPSSKSLPIIFSFEKQLVLALSVLQFACG